MLVSDYQISLHNLLTAFLQVSIHKVLREANGFRGTNKNVSDILRAQFFGDDTKQRDEDLPNMEVSPSSSWILQMQGGHQAARWRSSEYGGISWFSLDFSDVRRTRRSKVEIFRYEGMSLYSFDT